MKSKTSFFNKGIFRKNIITCWPIWSIYTLALLFLVPTMLAFGFSNLKRVPGEVTMSDRYVLVAQFLDFEDIVIWLIFIVALIIGMMLFRYMFQVKMCNMMLAFPTNKLELYVTNVVSGLVLLWVPQVLTFLVTVLVCLCNGMNDVSYVFEWLLVSMGISFVFYGMVVFCVQFTGQIIALPLYYLGLNYVYLVIKILFAGIFSEAVYGLSYSSVMKSFKGNFLSPLSYLRGYVYWKYDVPKGLDWIDNCTGLILRGGKVVFAYVVFAVVLYIASYFIYKIRKAEVCGDLIAFSFLRPVFRWGVGIFFALVSMVMLQGFRTNYLFRTCPAEVKYILVFIASLAAFFVAQMFVERSFRVFHKKILFESIGFIVGVFCILYGISCGGNKYQNYMPKSENIVDAQVFISEYSFILEKEQIDEICSIHKKIIDNAENLKKYEEEYYEENISQLHISIEYSLKDGSVFTREYTIVDSENTHDLYQTVHTYFSKPEMFLSGKFGKQYESIERFEAGSISVWDESEEAYKSYAIGSDACQKLYVAIKEDAAEGNIQKYNLGYNSGLEMYDLDFSISLTTKIKESTNQDYMAYEGTIYVENYDTDDDRYGYWNSEYSSTVYSYFKIGKDCKNTIAVLEELGVDFENLQME